MRSASIGRATIPNSTAFSLIVVMSRDVSLPASGRGFVGEPSTIAPAIGPVVSSVQLAARVPPTTAQSPRAARKKLFAFAWVGSGPAGPHIGDEAVRKLVLLVEHTDHFGLFDHQNSRGRNRGCRGHTKGLAS